MIEKVCMETWAKFKISRKFLVVHFHLITSFASYHAKYGSATLRVCKCMMNFLMTLFYFAA